MLVGSVALGWVLKNFTKANRRKRLEFHQKIPAAVEQVAMVVVPVPVANAEDH